MLPEYMGERVKFFLIILWVFALVWVIKQEIWGMLITLLITTHRDKTHTLFVCPFYHFITKRDEVSLYIILLVCIALPGIILIVIGETAAPLESNYVGSFISTTGILLIIISIIYLSIRLQFYGYYIIDKNLGPLDSILYSAKLSGGYVLELFIIGAALSLIVLISIIPFGVGLIISLPLSTVATSYLYLLLMKKA